MDIATAKFIIEFFKWCSIINSALYLFSCSIWMGIPNYIYNVHSKMGVFSGKKEEHSQLMYNLFGIWKLFIIIFNIVPYFVLWIILG